MGYSMFILMAYMVHDNMVHDNGRSQIYLIPQKCAWEAISNVCQAINIHDTMLVRLRTDSEELLVYTDFSFVGQKYLNTNFKPLFMKKSIISVFMFSWSISNVKFDLDLGL